MLSQAAKKKQPASNRRGAETSGRAVVAFNGLSPREWTILSRNVWDDVSSPRDSRHLDHGAVYPVKLAARLIKLYSAPRDLVLDPFLGIGSTCIAALESDRRSVGIELNSKFVTVAKAWVRERCGLFTEAEIEPIIIHADARQLLKYVEVESVQVTVTSPPYANFIKRSVEDRKRTHKSSKLVIENNSQVKVYSNDPNDLGNLEYADFLLACKSILADLLIATKPGGYAAWVVKDHRLPPTQPYVPMHSDLAKAAQEVGWKWHDLIIWNQNDQRSLVLLGYPSRFYTNQNCSFIVILRKDD
jgi:DNA modification methylase